MTKNWFDQWRGPHKADRIKLPKDCRKMEQSIKLCKKAADDPRIRLDFGKRIRTTLPLFLYKYVSTSDEFNSKTTRWTDLTCFNKILAF